MNNFNQNSPEAAFMRMFTAYTPHILIGVTVATFAIVGAMQFSYYSEAFTKSAEMLDWIFGLTIAIVTQSARFALMINGANHYAHNRKAKGIFSIIFSATLTAITSFEMSHLADLWATQNPAYGQAIPIITQMIIWLGFGLELMLISTVQGSADNTNRQQPKNYHQEEVFDLDPLLNGNGARR